MKYAPDKWIVVKITKDGTSIYKILGSWYGGYTGSDSWRLNSGVEKVFQSGIDNDTAFYVKGYSGSLYVCPQHKYGISVYAMGIANMYRDKMEQDGGKFEILTEAKGLKYMEDMCSGKKAKTAGSEL